jgi:hypothetical protein
VNPQPVDKLKEVAKSLGFEEVSQKVRRLKSILSPEPNAQHVGTKTKKYNTSPPAPPLGH